MKYTSVRRNPEKQSPTILPRTFPIPLSRTPENMMQHIMCWLW